MYLQDGFRLTMLSAASKSENTRQKRYIVALTDEEHLFLRDLVKKGTLFARKLTRAQCAQGQ